MRRPDTIGLARLPREVQSLLDAAAENALSAALQLQHLLEAHDETLEAEIRTRELEGDRIVRQLSTAVRHARLGEHDRVRLMALAEAMDDVTDAVARAADDSRSCDCRPGSRLLAGVTRDGARAVARVVALLDGPGTERQGALERIRQLADEGRRIRRVAVAEAVLEVGDPVTAIRRKDCLEHVAQGMTACAKVARAAERATAAAG